LRAAAKADGLAGVSFHTLRILPRRGSLRRGTRRSRSETYSDTQPFKRRTVTCIFLPPTFATPPTVSTRLSARS